MTIALGIDTGGTFTDAALVAYETGQILATAKAITTKHDLSIGILEAVDRVLEGIRQPVELVSLSTTLATNAIVEEKGAPVGLLLLGYKQRAVDFERLHRNPFVCQIAHVPGGHTTIGEEWQTLDLDAAQRAIVEMEPQVQAYAVSGFFSPRNPTHELRVKELIRRLTAKPATCGHELTHRLDAVRRAETVVLNASLIPLICQLIDAVEHAMAQREIQAPLMLVKCDGSLMNARVARERPIETILSGPAASAVGAYYLAQTSDAVVVDMGGTTTDIALFRDGQPVRNPLGARVGRYRTMVEAIDVHTVGLGGDSQVWLDKRQQIRIGPRRVIPICMLATRWLNVCRQLQAWLKAPPSQMHTSPTGEFIVLQQTNWTGSENPPAFESALLERMREGPQTWATLKEVIRYPQLYAGYLEQLERQDIIVRAGFTPTDAAHVLGKHHQWDKAAARLAAELFGQQLNTDG